MQPSIEDKSCIWDAIDACNDIQEFITGMTFTDFENSKMVRFAVERQLLVIGEASKNISEEFKKELESIPWKKIVGLRNIIAHEYGELLVERIWIVASENILDLKKSLVKFIE